MAAGFTTWTVLKNKPIAKLEPNLWYVSGRMARGTERKMVVAKRSDGDFVIFNAIALDPAGMAELEAYANLRYLLVPNGFHRQDAIIWKTRYPQLKVVFTRWMCVRDRAAWQAQLAQLAEATTRIIPGHGGIIEAQVGPALLGARALFG